MTSSTARWDRLLECRLYLVTGARMAAGDLDRFLAEVLKAGVSIVQLREKSMEAGPLLRHAEVFRRRTEQANALFIVNDRVDVALAAGADGVHLGQDDLPVEAARAQMGPDRIIGLSTHSIEQLREGLASTADYCAVGPVYATPTKPGRPAVGLDLVRSVAELAEKPVFAIGGIGPSNVEEVVGAGARRVAVVRALTESANPGSTVRALLGALD